MSNSNKKIQVKKEPTKDKVHNRLVILCITFTCILAVSIGILIYLIIKSLNSSGEEVKGYSIDGNIISFKTDDYNILKVKNGDEDAGYYVIQKNDNTVAKFAITDIQTFNEYLAEWKQTEQYSVNGKYIYGISEADDKVSYRLIGRYETTTYFMSADDKSALEDLANNIQIEKR